MATNLKPGAVYTLPLDRIHPSPLNKDRAAHRNVRYIAELAEQIASNIGQIHPGLARPLEGDPTMADLIVGKSRYLACQQAEMPMRVEIRTLTDDEAKELIAVENLTRENPEPWEVADALRELLDIYNDDYAIVADRIRRDARWVARHAVLKDLIPDWLKAWSKPVEYEVSNGYSRLKDGCLPVGDWSTGHMLLIARLGPESQAALLKDVEDDRDFYHYECGTIPDLRQTINERYLHRLKDAPFDTNDPSLIPVDGADTSCGACPHRSSCQASLFDDDESPEDDTCLDHACWGRKLEAIVEREVRRCIELDGEEPLRLTTEYFYGAKKKPKGVETASGYDAKSKKKGGRRAVFIDGPKVGTSAFVKKAKVGYTGNSASSSPAHDEKPAVKPLKERRERLNAKRYGERLSRLIRALDGDHAADAGLPFEKVQPDDVLRLAAFYGVEGRGYYYSTSDRKEALKELLGLFRGKLDTKKIAETIWPRLVPRIVEKMNYHGGSYTTLLEVNKEAETLAAILLGKSWWADTGAAIEEEMPEPKSWKNLNADGTPKKKAAKKKGSKADGK